MWICEDNKKNKCNIIYILKIIPHFILITEPPFGVSTVSVGGEGRKNVIGHGGGRELNVERAGENILRWWARVDGESLWIEKWVGCSLNVLRDENQRRDLTRDGTCAYGVIRRELHRHTLALGTIAHQQIGPNDCSRWSRICGLPNVNDGRPNIRSRDCKRSSQKM